MGGQKDNDDSSYKFEREIIKQLKRLNATQEILKETTERFAVATEQVVDGLAQVIEAIESLSEPPSTSATNFDITSRFEPVDPTATKASHLAISSNLEPIEGEQPMPGRNIGGPVPENHRVVFNIVPTAGPGGAPTALDGDFNAVNDQAQAPVIDMSNPLSIRMAIDPPPDRTAISTITGGDTDGEPNFVLTIDWDGTIVVVKADGFSFTSAFEPVS